MDNVFHEIPHDAVDTVLQHGLLLGTKGDKTSGAIHKTDTFLNSYRPQNLVKSGVDRVMNNYCYLSSDGKIIDITSGEKKSLGDFKRNHSQALLQISVDTHNCYVSDLDLYDQIMSLLIKADTKNARRLAHVYWDELTLLANYKASFRRPEVIVTYNIQPSAITQIA
jgi:hypothetical protein